MADRHFDLNAALAEAEAAPDDEQWTTFDLGPNYKPVRPLVTFDTDPETQEVIEHPYDGPDPEPAPWRINRLLPGWLLVKYLQSVTIGESWRVAGQIIQDSIDPDQWPQFEAYLTRTKVPLSVLDTLLNNIIKDQVGLPLGR